MIVYVLIALLGAGLIIFGIKKNKIVMVAGILIAVVGLFLTICAFILIEGAKNQPPSPDPDYDVSNGNNAGGGNNANADNEIVGADWRSWGIIDAYGKIITNGTETSVCVCLFIDRAEIYYDEASQRLYTTINYEKAITGDQLKNTNIIFSDLNGDGNTDITVVADAETDKELKMTFVYDKDDYVYMP